MDGNINTGKTCKMLKHLLDPSATKMAAKAEITKITQKYKGNIREMGDQIVKLYLARCPAVEHRDYSSPPTMILTETSPSKKSEQSCRR
ncbi:hypothetical protein HPB52_015984 [Rhipicephalus sanguineus]|uniref:Uncharacterized protein n=1 Tax=Rhipicephalus sanguineus TaxID=34632 RepID=A0A9D4Q7K4_RHISA|nr:hypothetical protein HPB52_015984 [Rhipicephalus sanguineus]